MTNIRMTSLFYILIKKPSEEQHSRGVAYNYKRLKVHDKLPACDYRHACMLFDKMVRLYTGKKDKYIIDFVQEVTTCDDDGSFTALLNAKIKLYTLRSVRIN